MSDNIGEIARARAKEKLAVIIDRFGDENGERLTASYLEQLVAEEMRAVALEKVTFSIFTEMKKTNAGGLPALVSMKEI